MRILFKNAKILDLDKEKGYFNGNVVVKDSIIELVSKDIPQGNFDKVIDVENNLLMPGLVNAHAHTPMTLLRGIKDDASLQEWLEHVNEFEGKLTDEEVYWGEMLGIAEYVKNGITTFEENYFLYDGLCDAISKSKIRARIGLGPRIFLTKLKNLHEYLNTNYELIKNKTDSNLVKIDIFAHSIYCINEEEFEGLISFAKEKDLPHSIHLCETLKEVGDCTVKHNNLTPPAYLEQLGFLDRECLCYHCVHMDKDDLQILADCGASVVTCPSSNIKLASGIAPIFAMQNKGLNIAIGTDGAASNNSLDMFKEMYLVATLSKVSLYDASVVSAREVIGMATIGGSKALGFNGGQVKEGKNADIILVNLNSPHMQPDDNLLSNIVYSARGSDVYLTMVGGNILYENGKYNIGENIEKIIKNANEIRNKFKKRV